MRDPPVGDPVLTEAPNRAAGIRTTVIATLPRPRLRRRHRSARSLRRLLPRRHAAIKSARRAKGFPLSAISTPTPQHHSAFALPPLCTGKPLPTCSQVKCLSRRRPEPQPRAKSTPAWSYQGRSTLLPSSP
jgi:hypothetical protein